MTRVAATLVAVSLASAAVPAGSGATPGLPDGAAARSEAVPSAIAGVLAPGTRIELVKDGFEFTEGPVATADGGLYFSDTQAKPTRVYRLDPGGVVRLLREGTNGVNGLALGTTGDLFAAEMYGKRIVQLGRDGQVVRAVVEEAPTHRLVQPNDLIVDARGGIYFTDPGTFDPTNTDKTYVYYFSPQKQLTVVTDRIGLPNGLTLTPDGRTLIVDDTRGDALLAFDIRRDGTTTNPRVFGRLVGTAPGKSSGADGMTVDSAGRVYVATSTGVQVLSDKGVHLGTIALPRVPANVAFGGLDRHWLYVTARQGLYRIRMLSEGAHRIGK